MKKLLVLIFAVSLSAVSMAQNNTHQLYQSFKIQIRNSVDIQRDDALVAVSVNEIKKSHPDFNELGFVLYVNDIEIPSQLFQTDNGNDICFVTNLMSGEVKDIEVYYGNDIEIDHRYKSRVYSEIAMKVKADYNGKIFVGQKFENMKKIVIPEFHIDHNALFKYEGAGWESDKVGYRMYIDWRNSIDIFGKKTNDLILDEVGAKDITPENEAYHESNDWGQDIFKVGNSLGLGTIAMNYNGKLEKVSDREKVVCEVTANGPIISELTIDYLGWLVGKTHYNVNSKISIAAGSRMTKVDLLIDNNPGNISTGLAKYEGTQFLASDVLGDWQYIALYGKQTLANDNLGIVTFYKKSTLIKKYEDELNYVVELKPDNGKVEYYFAAAWEQEPDGIKNLDEFKIYCDNVIGELNNQPEVVIY